VIEGWVYFGIILYLAIYFAEFVFKGTVEKPDVPAGWMVGTLTAGITIAMFFLGFLADKWGARRAIITAFCLMLLGRSLLAAGPTFFGAGGWFSPVWLFAAGGILLIVIGYGMYQPAAYAAVRQFTTPKTAAMGFAMLYALMNLGAVLPASLAPFRDAFGIPPTIWVYVGLTVVALASTAIILSRRTVTRAIAEAKAEREQIEAEETKDAAIDEKKPKGVEVPLAEELTEQKPSGIVNWLKNHPLANAKFSYFIFCLIPVQTLFAYVWLVMPIYVKRAYSGGWIGQYFEVVLSVNPALIFVLAPIVAALSQKVKVYKMMILGTFVMAAPAFLLAIGPIPWILFTYLFFMTLGEAMWQPRFLQYAAEIAPEGRTGTYMGVAQLPWFLTKVIAPLYTGTMLAHFCPEEGELNTETMWLVFGCIAICSTILLILAKPWIGKDFKTKAD